MGNSGVKHIKTDVDPEMDAAALQQKENSSFDIQLENSLELQLHSGTEVPTRNTNQDCTLQPELVPANAQANAAGEKLKKSGCKMTIEQYRKSVGIKVISSKPSQKLGIAVMPEPCNLQDSYTHSILGRTSSLKTGKGTLCPHCGYMSALFSNKCERCARAFSSKAKIVDLPPTNNQTVEFKEKISSQGLPSEVTYGTRRPRSQGSNSVRQERSKINEEPQCVTLSSDEDESECFSPELKKLKQAQCAPVQYTPEGSHTLSIPTSTSVAHSGENNVENGLSRSPTTKPIPRSSTDEDSFSASNATDDLADPGRVTALDLIRWKEGGLKGSFFAVAIRSVRIGSYKFSPIDHILFSSEGILLKAPVFEPDGRASSPRTVPVAVLTKNVLDIQVHFSRTLAVIFLRVCPSLSRQVSKKLGLSRENGTPFWDTASQEESHKRMTLLPHTLTETAKNAIKQAFAVSGIYKEISFADANEILVKSSPEASIRLPGKSNHSEGLQADSSFRNTFVSKENGSNFEMRTTRSMSSHSAVTNGGPVELMFAWSDGPDRFPITTEDYRCLNQDNLLNDSIIDFYLRYVFSTKLNDAQKAKCYVFSSFFYQRLTTRPPKRNGRKDPIEDDNTISMARKRHSRVKSWTKRVDIFEKDFLIIPINERSHWFLAIICFAGLSGPVSMKDNMPMELSCSQLQTIRAAPSKTTDKCSRVGGESFMIGNTTVTPVGPRSKSVKFPPVDSGVEMEKDEADSDDDGMVFNTELTATSTSATSVPSPKDVSEPIKQPCILFFDSLAGGSHLRVAATLREYLMEEYRGKKLETAAGGIADGSIVSRLFSKEVMPAACPNVPQQKNSFDCGVYVLEYAECFMKKPIMDFNLSKLSLLDWFPNHMVSRKRKNIQSLIIQLTHQTNPMSESIFKLLPLEDVRISLQSRRYVGATPAEAATDKTKSERMETDLNELAVSVEESDSVVGVKE